MAESAYLASTLVMGLLAVGVIVLVVRGRRWRHYVPQAAYAMDAGAAAPRSGLARVAGSTNTWTVAFVLLVVAALGGAVVTLSGTVSGEVLVAALVALTLVYLVAGVYIAMRSNGRPSSQAAAGSVVTLGLLFVLGVSAILVLGL